MDAWSGSRDPVTTQRSPAPDEVLARLDSLYHLVTAYGALLTALELQRPLSAATAWLEEEDLGGARPADLVRELASRGGAALAQALVEVGTAAALRHDRPTREALERLQAHAGRVARFNAAALLTSLTVPGATGLATAIEREALQREVQAFVQAVEHLTAAIRSEGRPSGLAASPPRPTRDAPARPPRDLPARAATVETSADRDLPAHAPDGEGGAAARGSDIASAPDAGRAAAPGHRLPALPLPEACERLRDLVEVFQDVLQGLADRQPDAAASPLVRSGRIPADRYAALAEELARGGGGLILDELLALEEAGAPAEQLDPIRRRLIDGVVTTVPRVLSRLSTMPHDAGREERAWLLHDLTTFVARLADLCAEGSLLRQRFREMTLALRARLDRSILRQGL